MYAHKFKLSLVCLVKNVSLLERSSMNPRLVVTVGKKANQEEGLVKLSFEAISLPGSSYESMDIFIKCLVVRVN